MTPTTPDPETPEPATPEGEPATASATAPDSAPAAPRATPRSASASRAAAAASASPGVSATPAAPAVPEPGPPPTTPAPETPLAPAPAAVPPPAAAHTSAEPELPPGMPASSTEELEPVAVAAMELLPQRPEVLAARSQVRASRVELEEELERMEAALRAAVDIKAKIRRNPVKVAGIAAGTGFLVVGGPRRVLRGARNAVFGKPAPLPKAMLPDEIEQAVKALGDDGDKVRGALERNFARYLEQNAPERQTRDLRSQLLFLGLPAARVLILRFGRQFIEQVLSSEAGFEDQLARVRARAAARGVGPTGEPTADPTREPPTSA